MKLSACVRPSALVATVATCLFVPALAWGAAEPGREASGEVVKVILGLVAIFVLAYLGGHPRIRALEARLGISQAVTAGFPFVLLGLIASQPGVDVLSEAVLAELRPVLPLGLGWIGFAIGFRFDVRALEGAPPGTSAAVALTTAVPFVAIAAACGLLLWNIGAAADDGFLRDALLLGTAGAVTARTAPELLGANTGEDRLSRIVQLDQVAAVVGLLFVAAYFRPHGPAVGWHLPGTAWIFVTFGIAAAIGGIVYATLACVRGSSQVTVVLLGAIALTSGLASFLRLSPIVVCSIAGVLLANFPGTWKPQVRQVLTRLERPIYLLFLVIAGALWQVGAWQGWLLMLVFVAARLVGKWLAAAAVRREDLAGLGTADQRTLAIAPMGSLSVAIIVNAQDLYFGRTVPWSVTAIIGGAILTEVVVQLAARSFGRNAATVRPPA